MVWVDIQEELPLSGSKVIVKTKTKYTDGKIFKIPIFLSFHSRLFIYLSIFIKDKKYKFDFTVII